MYLNYLFIAAPFLTYFPSWVQGKAALKNSTSFTPQQQDIPSEVFDMPSDKDTGRQFHVVSSRDSYLDAAHSFKYKGPPHGQITVIPQSSHYGEPILGGYSYGPGNPYGVHSSAGHYHCMLKI